MKVFARSSGNFFVVCRMGISRVKSIKQHIIIVNTVQILAILAFMLRSDP